MIVRYLTLGRIRGNVCMHRKNVFSNKSYVEAQDDGQ